MADSEHLAMIGRGVEAWNTWRSQWPSITPDLTGVDLSGASLSGVDLSRASLNRIDLSQADLRRAKLSRSGLFNAQFNGARLEGADLIGANLEEAQFVEAKMSEAVLRHSTLEAANFLGADLRRANLGRIDGEDARFRRADLRGADFEKADLLMAHFSRARLVGSCLRDANLNRADLAGADLTGVDLTGARMTGVNLCGATLHAAKIYGLSAWDVTTDRHTRQSDLSLAPPALLDDTTATDVTVDDLEVAQFTYLMLSNEKLRRVIDTITSKVVLILGRFTPERKVVLEGLREALRHHNLTPVLFDFDVPADRDITETVTLLARMARFVIADLTDPAPIPMELQAIAHDVAVPIRSIVHKDQDPFSMFATLRKYHWVLEPYRYSDLDELVANLDTDVIAPANAKRQELDGREGTG
jgi:uncharacterized protein YjbI with pentapeptide repeats